VLLLNNRSFVSNPEAPLFLAEMLLGILLACLRKCQHKGSNMDLPGQTDFRRLSNFFANFLPFIVLVFFDRIRESYALSECQRLMPIGNAEKHTSSSANSA
jgi:hypothetical protein